MSCEPSSICYEEEARERVRAGAVYKEFYKRVTLRLGDFLKHYKNLPNWLRWCGVRQRVIVNQDEKGTTSKWTAGQYYTDYGSKKAKKKANVWLKGIEEAEKVYAEYSAKRLLAPQSLQAWKRPPAPAAVSNRETTYWLSDGVERSSANSK